MAAKDAWFRWQATRGLQSPNRGFTLQYHAADIAVSDQSTPIRMTKHGDQLLNLTLLEAAASAAHMGERHRISSNIARVKLRTSARP
ncbi:hypothetical protein [Sphingomonas sp. Root1294]|uniref:hypothetical protein n=1 Tax=Sphingomonas sp. Root1294 TaxID=1736447 RepID=UPI000AA6D4AF|nr:hypothetical protein [Sphingomonas sp. Root1294]